jgi:quercetin dioxygenase-like cupin family protein
MEIVDLSAILNRDGDFEEALPLDASHTDWSLIRIAPQVRHEIGAADLEERVLLALGGNATLHLDGSRHTLASGHLVAIDPGPAFSLWCEGTEPFEALLITSPKPDEAS